MQKQKYLDEQMIQKNLQIKQLEERCTTEK
jgi:hypothetical protein